MRISKETALWLIVVAIALSVIGFVVMEGETICPHGQTYQVTKYEPYFDTKGKPGFRPVYGCR